MSDTIEKDRCVTLRIPPILARRMDGAVAARKIESRKYSMNDWIVDAIRSALDGPTQIDSGGIARLTTGQHRQVSGPRKSAAELAASIQGVSLGIGDQGKHVSESTDYDEPEPAGGAGPRGREGAAR